jgi:hypothetical protein
MKTINVYVLKKKHDINGNPLYHVFIPDVTGKIKGLRKLKTPHTYSFTSYNIGSYLRDYVFKNYKVKIER